MSIIGRNSYLEMGLVTDEVGASQLALRPQTYPIARLHTISTKAVKSGPNRGFRDSVMIATFLRG